MNDKVYKLVPKIQIPKGFPRAFISPKKLNIVASYVVPQAMSHDIQVTSLFNVSLCVCLATCHIALERHCLGRRNGEVLDGHGLGVSLFHFMLHPIDVCLQVWDIIFHLGPLGLGQFCAVQLQIKCLRKPPWSEGLIGRVSE